jgi:hypothetical protein
MSVSIEDRVIRLDGICRVEDAEPLLLLLQSGSARQVDLTGAGHLHTAVVQVLMAFQPEIIGPPGDPFVMRWLLPMLSKDDTG